MLYKNISDQPKFIVAGSVKRKIPSGGIINLSPTDLNHSGSTAQFFESTIAEEVIKKEKLADIPTKETTT